MLLLILFILSNVLNITPFLTNVLLKNDSQEFVKFCSEPPINCRCVNDDITPNNNTSIYDDLKNVETGKSVDVETAKITCSTMNESIPEELSALFAGQVLELDISKWNETYDHQYSFGNYCAMNFLVDSTSNFTNLKRLILTNNHLKEIPRELFQLFPCLEVLDLQQNKLTRLEDDIFIHQSKLQILRLQNNELLNITKSLFQRLEELILLNLSFNNIRELKADVFQDLSKLLYLIIDYNHQIHTLPGGLLLNLKSLKHFSIEGNNLTDLAVNTFHELVNLTYINIGNNDLKSLPANIFRDTNLTEVWLNDNQLSELPDVLFQACQYLKTIILDSNNLTSLGKPLFWNLQRLDILELGNNKLVSVDKELLRDTVNLEMFGLDNNQLMDIPGDLFQNLKKVKQIILTRNKLTTLNKTTFWGLTDLFVLSLHQNCLTSIDGEILRDTVNLEIFDLGNNQLTDIPGDLFRNLKKVRKIILARNKLTTLNKTMFRGLTALSGLSLYQNCLTTIDGEILRDTVNLEMFNLGNNQLTDIPGDLFKNLKKVQKIILARNKLTTLNKTTFRGLTDLSILSLENNNFTSIDGELLRDTVNLEMFSLDNNQLTDIPGDLFQNSRKVHEIWLASNQLTRLNRTTFWGLTDLFVLSLYQNRLTSIDGETLRDTTNLKEIILTNNQLTKIPGDLFQNSTRVQQIYLASNQLTTLNKTTVWGLRDLSVLLLYQNRLTSFNGEILRDAVNLKIFSLSDNQLTEIPGSLFKNSRRVQEIWLGKNQLMTLNRTMFWGLNDLSILILHQNRLVSIDEMILRDTVNLRIFSLSDNQLTEIPGGLFQHSKRILEIWLAKNQLTTLNRTTFWGLEDLSVLSLRHNNLTFVDETLFRDLRNLSELLLEGNKLSSIELSIFPYFNLQPETEDQNTSLLLLRHDNNEMNSFHLDNYEHSEEEQGRRLLQRKSFKRALKISLLNNSNSSDCQNYDFRRLFQEKLYFDSYRYLHVPESDERKLQCGRRENSTKRLICLNSEDIVWPTNVNDSGNCSCQSKEYDPTTIIRCTKLPSRLPQVTKTELYLLNIKPINLSQISKLIDLNNVEKLSLSSNALNKIDDLVIPRTLKELELHDNKLTSLSQNFLQILKNTDVNVSLHDNPWKCDCESVKGLLNFLRNSKEKIKKVLDIKCAGSDGATMITLNEDRLCYNYLRYVIPILVGFCVLCSFIILTILYHKYKYEIKVFMYAHKIFLWFATEREIDRNKEFDAFVSYCHQDEDFVAEQLVPGLENGGPFSYKLCLHYREWIPGELIAEQIIRSIENSRRTIIVLSRNYLTSRWGVMEFRAAHIKGLREGRTRVIIVLLEDLDPDVNLMGPELKAYITMRTYVKWGDSRFWNNLRYALPHHKQTTFRRRLNIVARRTQEELENEFVRENNEDRPSYVSPRPITHTDL